MNETETTERRIAGRFIRDVLKAGHCISVDDGGAICLSNSTSEAAILEAMFSTDEDILIVRDGTRQRVGSVWFIHGNGVHTISDYTDNAAMRALVKGADEVAEDIERRRT